MNFFEQELRSLLGDRPAFTGATFVGRVCIAPLGDGVRLKVEFATTDMGGRYDALELSVINAKEGTVDTLKEQCSVMLSNGRLVNGMVYLMNGGQVGMPSRSYYEDIRDAYIDLGRCTSDRIWSRRWRRRQYGAAMGRKGALWNEGDVQPHRRVPQATGDGCIGGGGHTAPVQGRTQLFV